jgi:hypothetical protein
MPNTTTVKKRCLNGTRKNKKTGNCESVLDNTCAICLDRIVSGQVKTKCKHQFHKGCLIGWCKRNRDKPTCPICRSDIAVTCKKIMPFNSEEVFRYTFLAGADEATIKHSVEQIDKIIHNPEFDVNVKSDWNKSILYELTHGYYNNSYLKPHVEYLLKHKDIIVSNDLVSSLISHKYTVMLALFNKHKKIPKALKGLL